MAWNSDTKNKAMHGAVSATVSGAMGALVGYRVAGGTASDKAMPAVGPVPLDLLATGAGVAVAALVKDPYAAQLGLDVAVGSACFFTATAGQSLGKKIKEKMKGAKGVPQLKSREELDNFIRNLREEEKVA